MPTPSTWRDGTEAHLPSADEGGVEAGTGRPLGPGTLYGALTRLEERGLIEALAPVERRRPYRLTGVGARVLEEQLHDLAEFAQVGLRRLGADG